MKITIPYILAASLMLRGGVTKPNTTRDSLSLKYEYKIPMNPDFLETVMVRQFCRQQANAICDTFVNNVVDNIHILQSRKKTVKQLLGPDVPVGKHCIHSLYKCYPERLRNDVFPEVYHNATNSYITEMEQKFGMHPGVMHKGVLYLSREKYVSARERFLARYTKLHEKGQITDSVLNSKISDFEKDHFTTDILTPGDIIIVGSGKYKGHAIMFLGVGFVKKVKGIETFIPDMNGEPIYGGFNKQSIKPLSVFAYDCCFKITAFNIRNITEMVFEQKFKLQDMGNNKTVVAPVWAWAPNSSQNFTKPYPLIQNDNPTNALHKRLAELQKQAEH